MRPFVIPLSLILALALLGAGGQSVAKAAVAFQTPEPLDTPLPTLGEQTAADAEQEAAARTSTPRPYVLLTPEPLLTPLPRHSAKPIRHAARPQPVATPMVITLPGGARNKGVTLTNGAVVYNLVFPLVGMPAPGQDFSVKLLNKPNLNQVEVSLTGKRGKAPAGAQTPALPAPRIEGAPITLGPAITGAADIQLQVAAPGTRDVEFSLDGQVVGCDQDAHDGFAIALDTSCYTNGFHTLRAIARNDRGAVVQTVEHTVLIQN